MSTLYLALLVPTLALASIEAIEPKELLISGEPEATRIVTVAKKGGDFDSIQAAIDSIKDASWSKRYLVYVAPGTYEERVRLPLYVDLEGAGERATAITSPGGSSLWDSATLGAGDNEIRSLSVWNSGGDAVAIGIRTGTIGGPRLGHVSVVVWGGQANYGIQGDKSPALASNVRIKVQGGDSTTNVGVEADWGVRDLDVEVSGGEASKNYGITGVREVSNVKVRLWGDDNSENTGVRGTMVGGNWMPLHLRDSSVAVSGKPTSFRRAIHGVPGEIHRSTVQAYGGVAIDSWPWPWEAGTGHIAFTQLAGEIVVPQGTKCFSVCDANLQPLGADCD